jgi:starch synthase
MRELGKISIVEAVNSHVGFQESILKQEYQSIGLPWRPFNFSEKNRRIEEYNTADFVLLPSEFVKRSFLKAGFPEEKIIKVPYGFNRLEDSNTSTELKDDSSFNVVYVGSISVRKGIRYLIEAFRRFRHPNKKLFIVGPVSQPSGIADLSIPDDVILTGVLKGEALEKIYKQATVFCLPSIEEGLALVLGEALSFGIPIIATENTGADDIITDGREGFIIPIKNSQQILDDANLYEKMRDCAVNKAKSLNGWNDTGQLLTQSLLDVYNGRKS